MPETVTTKTLKQGVLEMIQGLPDNCTLEEIQYHLHVYAGIQRAIADIDAGRIVPQDEVMQRVDEWLTSSGPKAQ